MADTSEAIYTAIEQRFSTEKMSALLDLLDQLKTAADGLAADDLPPTPAPITQTGRGR
jgi:hypothetical protein